MLRAKRASFGSLPSIAQTTVPRFDVVGGVAAGLNGGFGTSSITASLGADVFVDIWTYPNSGSIAAVSCNGTAMPLLDNSIPNNTAGQGNLWRYRAAGAGTGKSITVQWLTSGFGWFTGQVFSIKGVTSVSAPQKAWGVGTALSQTVTASSGLIVQGFVSAVNGSAVASSAWSGGTMAAYATYFGGPHTVSYARASSAASTATVKGTANAVLGTSVTIPAHAAGDVIVVFAYQNGISAPPTPPAASGTVPAWVSIQAGGSNSNGSGVWSFTATADNHTSGTWSSCTGLIAVVIQGAHPTNPIGGFAFNSVNGSSTAPAITQSVTNGTSCLLYFHGHRSNVTALNAPPAGFTRRAEAIGSSGICLNTKDVTTTDGAATQIDNGNGGSVGQTVEILAGGYQGFTATSSSLPWAGLAHILT
jgi:hypothetical protein